MKQEDGLRTWLEQVDGLGELRTIEGADWDLEIGGVADLVTERGSSPAVLFDAVKGYPKGHRVLVNSLGSTERLGLTLGMPRNLSSLDFVTEWRRRSKDFKNIPPMVVTDGPVLENIRRGKDVDILSFPMARWFELDGGRYIGTGSVFFFSSRRRHTRSDRDWSSDVCSSDLIQGFRSENRVRSSRAGLRARIARAAASLDVLLTSGEASVS